MNNLTSWKVYHYKTNSGLEKTVVVGYDTTENKGIVEEVVSSSEGVINNYKLFGGHNHYFDGFNQLWMDYTTANDVNSITDVSDQYQ